MNKVLHFRNSEDRKVLITSDTHLRHNNPHSGLIWKGRGFPDSESHTTAVIDSINAITRAGDDLIHLGDLCLNTNEEELNEVLSRIVCQNIYLVWGNHNNPLWKIYQRELANRYYTKGHTSYRIDPSTNQKIFGDIFTELPATDIEIYPFRYKNIVFVGNYLEFTINGKYFIGSHYPIYVFNYMRDRAMHVCGHSHYNLELSKAENPNSKTLDVGWDGHKMPWTFDEVMSVMNTKENQILDHHGAIKKTVTQ